MNEVFHLIPPKIGPYLAVVIVGFVVLAIVVLLLLVVLSSRGTSLAVTNSELRVQSLFYSVRVPLTNVDTSEISEINLAGSLDKTPTTRLFGISIAGLQLGWFRLKDGTKALLFVTDRSSVVYVPTTEFAVVASINSPMALKTTIEKASAK